MLRTRGVLGAALRAIVLGVAIASVSGQRGAPPVPAPLSPLLRDYQPVTAERLKNPEDQNWLMIYIPANNNLCGSNMGVQPQYTPGRPFVGIGGSRPFIREGADHVGEVQAWNVDTAQKVWTHEYRKSPNWGGMLVTAGGVVFSGGTSDRRFHAFDATTGKLLWEFPMNSGALAPPSSFSVDGKQYVAVETGWGGDSRGMQATLNNLFPGEYPEVPEGGAIWAFALD